MLAGSPAEFPTPWRSADRRCASPTVVLFAAEVKSSPRRRAASTAARTCASDVVQLLTDRHVSAVTADSQYPHDPLHDQPVGALDHADLFANSGPVDQASKIPEMS
jgi:4'-phosphopantetheinyl transferase EntD